MISSHEAPSQIISDSIQRQTLYRSNKAGKRVGTKCGQKAFSVKPFIPDFPCGHNNSDYNLGNPGQGVRRRDHRGGSHGSRDPGWGVRHAGGAQRVREAAGILGIEELPARKPKALSGGQCRTLYLDLARMHLFEPVSE